MKRFIHTFLALVLGTMLSLLLAANTPADAQEDLDTVLARSAAKSFLTTLTRSELAGTREFYTVDGLQLDGFLDEFGNVSGYKITSAEWLFPNETFAVEATLQPGNKAIVIRTGKYSGRWQVEGVKLLTSSAAGAATTGTATTAATPSSPQEQSQSVAGNGMGKLVFQTSSGGNIYVINPDGTGLSRVTHGIDPQLSPDGTQIAFTRWDPQYELFTINVDGTNERAWFSNKRQMKSATWSADGSKLIFSHQVGGRLEGDNKSIDLDELAEKAAKGENLPRIPPYARDVRVDDGVLRWYIPADAYWWLAEIDLETGNYTDLSTGSRYNYAPTGHPTNPDQLIFRSDQGMGLYDDEAQTSYPVSHDDRDRGAISISPDGTKVAFTYSQDGHWEIHTMNIDGTNRQRLTKTPLSAVANQNTAGNEVFINEEGFRTMERAKPGGMPNNNWNNAAPVWSPDGSQIAFVTDRTGKWEIWIMNADGSNQRPMFSNGALEGIELNFAGVDERMLSWR